MEQGHSEDELRLKALLDDGPLVPWLLRADERAAVLLHYRHELTHPEISETMGLPLGTIKSLIRRSREKLKRFYESKTDARQPWNKDTPKTNSA